jgi:hypothetical protein
MWSKRAYVDFALKKRATVASIYRGLNTTSDACDADPYLRRAAKFHGVTTERDCPNCNTFSEINSANTRDALRPMTN